MPMDQQNNQENSSSLRDKVDKYYQKALDAMAYCGYKKSVPPTELINKKIRFAYGHQNSQELISVITGVNLGTQNSKPFLALTVAAGYIGDEFPTRLFRLICIDDGHGWRAEIASKKTKNAIVCNVNAPPAIFGSVIIPHP